MKPIVTLSAISKRLLPILALLLSASAFAVNKGSFNLYGPVTVSGKQLTKGQYQVQWEGSGPDVQVSILSRGKVVTTVPAHLIELTRSGDSDATVWNKKDDGTKSLSEIDFAGKKYALDFRSANAATDSGSKADPAQ